MPRFKYAAVDNTGATVEGVAKGETIGAVRTLLKTKDLVPIRIEEHRGRLDLELTKEKLKRKELMHFSRQLAVFVRSGIPILDALDTIAEEAQDRVLRKVIVSMTDQLRQGSTFSAAAREHPEAFPAYYLGVLESAELTGNLDDTLDKLARYRALLPDLTWTSDGISVDGAYWPATYDGVGDGKRVGVSVLDVHSYQTSAVGHLDYIGRYLVGPQRHGFFVGEFGSDAASGAVWDSQARAVTEDVAVTLATAHPGFAGLCVHSGGPKVPHCWQAGPVPQIER